MAEADRGLGIPPRTDITAAATFISGGAAAATTNSTSNNNDNNIDINVCNCKLIILGKSLEANRETWTRPKDDNRKTEDEVVLDQCYVKGESEEGMKRGREELLQRGRERNETGTVRNRRKPEEKWRN